MAASSRRGILRYGLSFASGSFTAFSTNTIAQQVKDKKTFSHYILRATEVISKTKSGKGYLRNSSFSDTLSFGSAGRFTAKAPPYTMCVSGVFEVIITAINLYTAETGDISPYTFLPFSSWTRLRPFDLRGQVWLVEKSESYGTAHALQKFGMGSVVDFAHLEAGALVNLNRINRSGHATIFLGYIDKAGNLYPQYTPQAAGFKYFSSQGNEINGGFGYRYAFFSDAGCPTLVDRQKRRDCGIIRSRESMLLNSGIMWHPKEWEKRKALEQLSREAYHIQRGDADLLVDGDIDSSYFNGRTTDD